MNVRFYLLNLFFGKDCTAREEKSHKDCYSVPSPSSDFSRIPFPQASVSQAHCRSPQTHLFFTPSPTPFLTWKCFLQGFIPRFVQTILPFPSLPGALAELGWTSPPLPNTIKPKALTLEKVRRRTQEGIINQPTKQQKHHRTPPTDNYPHKTCCQMSAC